MQDYSLLLLLQLTLTQNYILQSFHFLQLKNLGHGPFTWSYFSLTNNRIGWGFGTQILTEELQKENDTSRSSDWGPESTQALCGQIQDYQVPIGGTMGDLIHETPRDSISRLMLEEKLFETWYHQRTVLIGDGSCKLEP